jgi:hypothetical protein
MIVVDPQFLRAGIKFTTAYTNSGGEWVENCFDVPVCRRALRPRIKGFISISRRGVLTWRHWTMESRFGDLVATEGDGRLEIDGAVFVASKTGIQADSSLAPAAPLGWVCGITLIRDLSHITGLEIPDRLTGNHWHRGRIPGSFSDDRLGWLPGQDTKQR